MRTIRRVSRKLNCEKWKRLIELVLSYAYEKDAHLLFFGTDASFASHQSILHETPPWGGVSWSIGKEEISW
jgi:hypothetical protein